MSTVPNKIVDKIQYSEDHIAPFTTNAVAIGTSSAAVTDLTTKTTAARAAYTAQQAAQNTAKAATLTLQNALDVMGVALQGIIDQVNVKAKTTGDLGVYALAELPAPATPTPVGAPGLPFQFVSELMPNGTLNLTWKCNNPAGCNNVIYQVYRKVDSTGAYEYIGGTGERKFTDMSVPQGVPSVMYQIQGTRSTASGNAAEFIVNFGVNSGGAITATVANATKPAKIAA